MLKRFAMSILLVCSGMAHSATIGFDAITSYGAITQAAATTPHFATTYAPAMFTPTDAQEVYEVGYWAQLGPGSYEVGVYRRDTGARIVSAIVTSTGEGRRVTAVTPTALTIGVTYFVSWRVVTDNSTIYVMGVDPAVRGERNTSLMGTNPLADTWASNGSPLLTEFAVFATTRAASGGGSSALPTIIQQLEN